MLKQLEVAVFLRGRQRVSNKTSPFTALHRSRLASRLLYWCGAFALLLVILSVGPVQRTALAGALSTVQRYTLCSSSTINRSSLARLQAALYTRLTTDRGVSAVQVTRASGRCLTVMVTGPRSEVGNVVAAGRVGNVVITDSERQNLAEGTRVRLVCAKPRCAPGVKEGRADPAAHPPILRVVLADRDMIRTPGAVHLLTDGGGTCCGVAYHLTKQALHRWCSFTKSHLGRTAATVVDSVALWDPMILSPMCGVPLIFPQQGQWDYWFAGYVKTGPLPVALRLVV
jgi:hypothetical protein